MSAALPAIHVHRPRVSVSEGSCPVCDRPLGPDPALVQSGGRSEWICASCLSATETALAQVGKRRVEEFVTGKGHP